MDQSHGAPLALAWVGVVQGVGRLQAQQGFNLGQQAGLWRLGAGGAQQHAGALPAKGHAGGKAKPGHQGAQGLQRGVGLVGWQPGHGQQRPGQLGFFDAHGRVFELGLLGGGAKGRGGQGIDAGQRLTVGAQTAQILAAPVHGHEGLRQAQFVTGLHRHHQGAALAGDLHQAAFGQTAPHHVLGVHLNDRLGHMAKQTAQRAGAAHAVPLVAQAAGGQGKRKPRLARFGHGPVRQGGKAGLAIRCGELAVFKQAGPAHGLALGQGPLLGRLVKQGVAQAGDVKVPPTGGLAVLVPDGLGGGIGKQAGGDALDFFQSPRQINANLPVVTRLTRCGHGGAHAGDAAFAVGDRAFFFTPSGGG